MDDRSDSAEAALSRGRLRNSPHRRQTIHFAGWMTGFEPAIPRSTIWCLNR